MWVDKAKHAAEGAKEAEKAAIYCGDDGNILREKRHHMVCIPAWLPASSI